MTGLKDQKVKKVYLRRKGTKDINKKHMGIPIETWCPATRVAKPIARTCFVNDKQKSFYVESDCDTADITPQALMRRKLEWSEVEGHRLLQAWVRYRDPKGVVKLGRIQLDSQSKVNYSVPGVSLTREWNPGEQADVVGMKGEPVPLGKPLTFTLYKDNIPIVIDTNEPVNGTLSDDCIALLGVDAIEMLGIDLNYAVKHHRHHMLRFQDDTQKIMER